MTRFTASAVVSPSLFDVSQRIVEIVDRELGTVPGSETVNLIEFLRETGYWDDFDLQDLIWWLEREFDLRCSRADWDAFFGFEISDAKQWEQTVAPRLTFAALAEFIHRHLVSFAPVNVAGTTCAAAGAFLGLSDIVRHRFPNAPRFAPSTPIHACLRGRQLRRFWERVNWWTDGRFGDLPRAWRPTFLGLWLVLVSLPCHWLTFRTSLYWLASVLLVEHGLRLWVSERIDRAINPLPPDIVTFRDLAEALSRPAA